MRAVIIGNGDMTDHAHMRSYIREDDFVICADGGIRHARRMGIEPDIVIGDFDSAEKPDTKSIEYPARKDLTDGELCVRYAAEHNFDEVLLIAMTGRRTDHMLTNIFMLRQCGKGYMADEKNEIYYLRDNISLKNKKGMTLSIIPVNGDLNGIVTEGLEYPLRGETLYFGTGRGNSNVIIGDICSISISSGEGVVIVNNGE